jgi:hypothetical protein
MTTKRENTAKLSISSPGACGCAPPRRRQTMTLGDLMRGRLSVWLPVTTCSLRVGKDPVMDQVSWLEWHDDDWPGDVLRDRPRGKGIRAKPDDDALAVVTELFLRDLGELMERTGRDDWNKLASGNLGTFHKRMAAEAVESIGKAKVTWSAADELAPRPVDEEGGQDDI